MRKHEIPRIQQRALFTTCILVVTATVTVTFAQGIFQNLDFEGARITPTPDLPWHVMAADALPGWTAGVDGEVIPSIVYNTVSIGAAAISIHDRNSNWPVFEGNFTVFLQTEFLGRNVPWLSQTGLVPDWAKSLRFDSDPDPGLSVTLGGQALQIEPLSDRLWGANIGEFAGETLELRFAGAGWLDAITFSPLEIPEPRSTVLVVLGGVVALFGLRRRSAENPD